MSQGHRVTWDEAQSFADLLAAFFRRTGRDPTDEETEALVATARQIVACGVAPLQ